MKQDEIIEMAMKSGCPKENALANMDILEDFAKLVAAKEREEFAVHAVDIARRAIAEEREACAKIVEVEAMQYAEPVWAFEIVNDIRARGTEA